MSGLQTQLLVAAETRPAQATN